jgi:hypothetical protein
MMAMPSLRNVFREGRSWDWGFQGPTWYKNISGHPDVLSFQELLQKDPTAGRAYRQIFQSEIDLVILDPESYGVPSDEAQRLRDPKTDPMSVFGIMSFFFPGEQDHEWFVFIDGGSNPIDDWLLWDGQRWVGRAEGSEMVSNGSVTGGTPEQSAEIDRLYDRYPKIAKGVPGARQK